MAGSPALVSCQPTPRPVRGEGQDDTGVHSVPESADVRGNACQSDMKMGYVDCQGTCHRVRSLSTATNDPIFLAHATRDSVMEVRAESWWGRSSLTIRCLLSPLAFSPLAGHKLNSYLLFRQPLRLSKLDLSVGPVTSRRPIIRPFTFNMLRGERSSTAHRRGRIEVHQHQERGRERHRHPRLTAVAELKWALPADRGELVRVIHGSPPWPN